MTDRLQDQFRLAEERLAVIDQERMQVIALLERLREQERQASEHETKGFHAGSSAADKIRLFIGLFRGGEG
jgi:hypothetical protein